MLRTCVFCLFMSFTFHIKVVTAYRLSRDVKPLHYSLKLRPDMDTNTFRGEVTIIVRIEKYLEKITLHSSKLNITEAFANQLPANTTEEDDEKVSLSYENGNFQPGEHRIFFKYNGNLQENFGMVQASYKYNNHSGFLVVNEFEPTGARNAFPCFDEPSFKAKFNIRLVTPNDSYTAVSNMPEIARYVTSYGTIYDFATSVEMSTYLVSLAITDYPFYEQIFNHGNRKIPIRVYTYNASQENNKYAIEAAKAAIGFYSNYTGIDYPLPKLDMIEYNKGKIAATETWGLIQFKEGLLTTNLKIYDKWQCHLVIFHELAHFWFGNLVTNNWWNDLWLQEGFATFMSYKYMSSHFKNTVNIKLLDLYEIEERSGIRPLVDYLVTTDYIEKRFDGVVYEKGAFVLRTLETIVGQKEFQEVMRKFLKKFAFGTATTNDLISEFEVLNLNVNIRAFLDSYIYQTGYPTINVDDSSGKFVLTQIDVINANLGFRQKWTIPISYTYGNNTTTNLIWFDKDTESVTIEELADVDWILFNNIAKLPGLYFVNYSDTMWSNILEHLEEIPDDDAKNLAENAGVLYLSKQINCDIILQLVDQLNESLLDSIFKVTMKVAKKLACFKSEYDILVEYLTQKIEKVDVLLQHFNATCDSEGNKTSDDHTRLCSQWVNKNLANFIKSN